MMEDAVVSIEGDDVDGEVTCHGDVERARNGDKHKKEMWVQA